MRVNRVHALLNPAVVTHPTDTKAEEPHPGGAPSELRPPLAGSPDERGSSLLGRRARLVGVGWAPLGALDETGMGEDRGA